MMGSTPENKMTQMTDLVLDQLEFLAEDENRSTDESRLLKIHLRELKSELERLAKIEAAAMRIAQQTNAERAYALHDDLIVALEGSNVKVRGCRAFAAVPLDRQVGGQRP